MKRKDLLPSRPFQRGVSGGAVSLRAGRGPRAVVTLHGPGCGECLRYLESVSGARAAAAEWDGRFIAVVPPAPGQTPTEAPAAEGVEVLEDTAGDLADGRARVAVADEWGEVFFAMDAGEGHELPAPAELVDWLRFAAIQCPECESPEGGWRAL